MNLHTTLTIAATLLAASTFAAEYHVAVTGDDAADGSASKPLKTISAAAKLAQPGDTVTVHAGVYRECVTPPRGGTSDASRITYQAAPGEKVTITGSEQFKTWEKVSGDTWTLTLPNSYFGDFNPYAEKVWGDWFDSKDRTHHRGNVYLNGVWMDEAPSLDAVMKPVGNNPMWFAKADEKTTIYAQFPAGINPNAGAVEVCVRPTVFTPEKTNIDYITVRGFDLRNAATNWAAPTMGQRGLITAYWCKGWVIENNEISYSRCCGVALGKNSDQWDGKRGSTKGYYLTIDDAITKDGWCKEKIGGHLVRNNHIHHCGQTGIVGSLGCAFSRIEGNEIHDCNMQGIWDGAEMAGIKFHGAIDTVITGNHIYRNGKLAGIWLDWMAQGTQITNNLFHDNGCIDLFMEVNHGPFLVANNIFLSGNAHLAYSHGGAYTHNLIVGTLKIQGDKRRTPFHKAHSTEPYQIPTGSPWPTLTLHDCPAGDYRLYNNLLSARASLNAFDRPAPDWPVTAVGNVFTRGSKPSKFDTEALLKPDFDAGVKLTKKADGWYLKLNADSKWSVEQQRQLVTTELLGKAKMPNQAFTNPDQSLLKIDTDYFGKPRNPQNPFPGPFETLKDGPQEIKVWPNMIW